jgi:nicotinamide mononucleotide transporter
MIDFFQQVGNDLLASSVWELAAVILAVAYLLLAMKQNQWCWPAAFVSTAIYTVLFWESALLMESVLNAYYLLMAVYGWWAWHQKSDSSTERKIVSWQLSTHVKVIVGLSLISAVVGYLMATYTHADYAYLDAATTVFAIFTTWMVTQKVLENWLYWLVIDGVSIYLYMAKSFNLTALLFMFYCVMVIIGYRQWRVSYILAKEPSC